MRNQKLQFIIFSAFSIPSSCSSRFSEMEWLSGSFHGKFTSLIFSILLTSIKFFYSSKSLRTPSNMFIINLAICDFVMMAKAPIFIYNAFSRGFASGTLGCKIFALMGSFSGIGAGMTNAAIAYDRYSTIAKPLSGRLSMKKAFLMLFLIWFYTTPWAVIPFMELWGRFVPEGYLTVRLIYKILKNSNLLFNSHVHLTTCPTPLIITCLLAPSLYSHMLSQ